METRYFVGAAAGLGAFAFYLWRKASTVSSLGGLFSNKIIYISATWCSACQKFSPRFAKWASENNVDVKQIIIKDWNDPAIKKYGSKSIPYTLLNGKTVDPEKLLLMKF